MNEVPGVRCRHAFECASVHANGDVVCSIIDGRGDFVLGNVYEEALTQIIHSEAATRLRELMLSRTDAYCPAIGKPCALKTIPRQEGETPTVQLRYLAIEPTTACDLRCLTCPVRDFAGDVTWRDAYHDGGLSFFVWDGVRRAKQHAADKARRLLPVLNINSHALSPTVASMLRGRIPRSRTGTLPIDVIKRVLDEAGSSLRLIDFFQYGEPFLYRHLIEALRHARHRMPGARIQISTDGMQIKESVEQVVVDEQLVDCLVFSVDGCDDDSYRRYRIGGDFKTAFANLVRFHKRASRTRLRVIWQYVVFSWNDSDEHFRRAIEMAGHNDALKIWRILCLT